MRYKMVGLEFLAEYYEVWIVDFGQHRPAMMAALRKALPPMSISEARALVDQPLPVLLGKFEGAILVAKAGEILEGAGARLQIIAAPDVYNLDPYLESTLPARRRKPAGPGTVYNFDQFLDATLRRLHFVTEELDHPWGFRGRVIHMPDRRLDPIFAPPTQAYQFLATDGTPEPAHHEWLRKAIGLPDTERFARQVELQKHTNIAWLQELVKKDPTHAETAKAQLRLWERYIDEELSLEQAEEAVALLPSLPGPPCY